MAEQNPKKTRTQSNHLSDSDSSEDETSMHLHTSPEELAHTTAQCNPTVERGPAKQPKIKKL